MALYFMILILLVYCLYKIIKRIQLINNLSWIPGPPSLPIFGNYFDIISVNPEDAFINMNKYYKKYGKTYKLWIGTTPVVHCQDQEIIQSVFREEDKTCRPPMYVLVRGFLGPGLLFGEADHKWYVHRKHLSESFHTDILKENINLTINKIKQLFNILDQEMRPDQPIDLIKFTKPCFLDVSLESIAGFQSNYLKEPETCPYLNAIERMSELVMARTFSPILKHNFIFTLSPLQKLNTETKNIIQQIMSNIVSKRRTEVLNNSQISSNKRIIVDAMIAMENKNDKFSSKDVENQVSNNILASYDTLATVTSFLLFILGNNPKIQDDLIEEINTFAPNILEEGITLKDLNSLNLLDRCVKETLRMLPAAPLIGRHLLKPFKTKYGTLPAGVDVYTNLFNYHRDPEVFPNPDEFDPDRFLPENSSRRHPLSYIPFGLGARACIGQKTAVNQSKVAVAMLIKKYSVKSFENLNDLKFIANLVLKSRDGIRVYLSPRD